MVDTGLTLAIEVFSASNNGKGDDSIPFLHSFDFRPNLIHDSNSFVAHDVALLHGRIQFARAWSHMTLSVPDATALLSVFPNLHMCRLDPHIVQWVILTIASLGAVIIGLGTGLTAMVFAPMY